MAEHNIKYNIQSELSPEEQETAMDFVRFLKEKQLSFYKDNGAYWKDKIYYWVKQNEDCVCFIAIKNPDEKINHWTIWSADMSFEWIGKESISDEVKETAWKYVNYCKNCSSCGGGRRKVIFGREFDYVCGCTFRIDNPKNEDLLFMKKMVEIRMKEKVCDLK